MKLQIKESDDKITAKNFQELIDKLEAHGYSCEHYYDMDYPNSNWLYITKDGDSYEVEFYKYRDGEYELYLHNIHPTKEKSYNESYDSDYTYEDRYERIKSKSVCDFNGFYTDYTMYYDNEEDRFVFIFGDNDIYDPYNSEPDWECETEEEAEDWYDDYNGFEDDLDENINRFTIKEKISDNDYSQSKKGKAYKVFKVKNGKLYPPMVANPGGEDTPLGVWLDAEEGEFAGLSKTGRKQVKSTGSGNLAYRPGWHLGDVPRAKQFDRSFSWQVVDNVDENDVVKTINNYSTFINSYAKTANIGNIYYINDIDKYVQVTNDNAPYFPYDFIWAECEYVMDIDYQGEADEQGYVRTKADGSTYRSDKYQHSLAGLPKLPKNGYYKYRTNPNPDTVPWVITGAIKVTKLLDDYDVEKILGGNAPERQGGNKTLAELGLKQI